MMVFELLLDNLQKSAHGFPAFIFDRDDEVYFCGRLLCVTMRKNDRLGDFDAVDCLGDSIAHFYRCIEKPQFHESQVLSLQCPLPYSGPI